MKKYKLYCGNHIFRPIFTFDEGMYWYDRLTELGYTNIGLFRIH